MAAVTCAGSLEALVTAWRASRHPDCSMCPHVGAPAVTLAWGCAQRFCSASVPPSSQQISEEQPWYVSQYQIPGSTDPAGREAQDSSRAMPMGLEGREGVWGLGGLR